MLGRKPSFILYTHSYWSEGEYIPVLCKTRNKIQPSLHIWIQIFSYIQKGKSIKRAEWTDSSGRVPLAHGRSTKASSWGRVSIWLKHRVLLALIPELNCTGLQFLDFTHSIAYGWLSWLAWPRAWFKLSLSGLSPYCSCLVRWSPPLCLRGYMRIC